MLSVMIIRNSRIHRSSLKSPPEDQTKRLCVKSESVDHETSLGFEGRSLTVIHINLIPERDILVYFIKR